MRGMSPHVLEEVSRVIDPSSGEGVGKRLTQAGRAEESARPLIGGHRYAEDDEPEEAEEQRDGAGHPPPELRGEAGRALCRQATEGPLAVTAPHVRLQSGETDSVLQL